MRAAAFVLTALLACPIAAAQHHGFVNARITSRTPQPDVSKAVAAIVAAQVEPAWIAYAVPAFRGDRPARHDGWSERCRLEQQQVDPATSAAVRGPLRLEPAPTVVVLARVQANQVGRVRAVSGDCQIDAGGLPLFWMGNVSGSESVEFLKTLVAGPDGRDRSEGALAALALHGDPAAADAILDLARNGSPRVRQRAFFWIAQRAEAKAAALITQAISDDPDAEVKKQAVFALSQLPDGEGIPMLITLARSQGPQAVRRQAMFWLGQSRDPRALRFFEEVLR